MRTWRERTWAWLNLERAKLNDAHLEGAFLFMAHLEEARLFGAHWTCPDFVPVSFERYYR
jgi:uncharacterized protein YjbI with pentapeptide repeats